MSEEIKTTDGSNPENPADGNNDQGKKQDGFVKFETYDKVMNRMKKLESIVADKDQTISSFQTEIKQREESELAKNGEYKKLLELEKAKNQDLNNKVTEVSGERDSMFQTVVRARKEQAVIEKLPGKVKNTAYYDFISWDDVAMNPETGEIDHESAVQVANTFAEKHPELLEAKQMGKLPSGATPYGYQPKDFSQVPVADMRKEAAAMVREKIRNL